MFHWVPTILFDNSECTGFADVVSVPANSGAWMNSWNTGNLKNRNLNNKISSVMVPPGYMLDLYDTDFDSESYRIVGRMRDDGAGIYCHRLPGTGFNDKASALKLIELDPDFGLN